ncbi:MAG TPA: ATP-binding protein [Anaerolineales bacterium]
MREIALHLLDIAENSVAAQASNITLAVTEDLHHDRLEATITDDGKGMDAETAARVIDPFVTSRTTRKVGLGIPLLKAAAEACSGGLQIVSAPGRGTCLKVDFQRSHIDRMPLGDLPGTLLTLVVAYPQIHWVLDYQAIFPGGAGPTGFLFDDRPIKAELGDLPLTEPDVLAFLRQYLEQGIAEVQAAAQTDTITVLKK